MCQKSLTEICTKSYLVKSSGHHQFSTSFIFQKKDARCKKSQVQLSICQMKCHFNGAKSMSMSELLTICLKLLNCKSSCDVRLQVWFIFHSHWCLKSVSSQGYGSNTQLLPPNITAYSQFLESTETTDIINVPVTF